MQLSDFKQLVADYMNRDATQAFQVGTAGKDKVLIALNNARNFAQRLVKFEAARTYAQLTVSSTTGGDLSTAVLMSDGVTACRIRNIEKAFCLDTNGSWYPIDVVNMAAEMERLQASYDPNDSQSVPPLKTSEPPKLVKDGGLVWYIPAPDSATSWTTKLRVLRWMPDLTTATVGTYEDFFLVECADWLLYKCVQELNFFLKEDQRVAISDTAVNRAWESVKAWNAEQQTTTGELGLD